MKHRVPSTNDLYAFDIIHVQSRPVDNVPAIVACMIDPTPVDLDDHSAFIQTTNRYLVARASHKWIDALYINATNFGQHIC